MEVPSKVPNGDAEMVNQVYEEFSDLFNSEIFGPEKAFLVTSLEHPISMFLPEPKSFQAILKQPPEISEL
eukprot:15344434-Ditylum_brightwellii.AAC.1